MCVEKLAAYVKWPYNRAGTVLRTGMVTESATISPNGLTIVTKDLSVSIVSIESDGTEKVCDFVG